MRSACHKKAPCPATGRGAFAFSGEGLAHDVALCPDDLHHFIHVLLAGLLLRGLYHDTEDRLGAGLPDENAASVAQLLGYLLDFGLHIRVRLGGCLVGDADVLQHLGGKSSGARPAR